MKKLLVISVSLTTLLLLSACMESKKPDSTVYENTKNQTSESDFN
jgi:PBP1b-binding outer membrane lipoprotein LpoB